MPRLRPDGTHYPSMLPKRCEFCGAVGAPHAKVFTVDGVLAHKACRPVRLCSIRRCENPAKGRTLCSHHYNRRYYFNDIAAQRERSRQWAIDNPDKRAARQALRAPEDLRAMARRWYWNNRIRALARAHNTRAARLGLAGFVTAEQLLGRLAMFGGNCYMCGSSADGFDHVKPLSAGGPHLAANMRPACTSCNSRKGSEWKGVQSWLAA